MIERLFTSKNRVKILEFLLFKKDETYIREISNELKMPVSAVKREIDNLILIGLIKKVNNKIYINEQCNFISDIKNIFIKTESIFYPISKILIQQNIKFALIFGSFAKGEFKQDSDVDLLIIGNIKLSELYKLLKPVENQIQRDINPVVWTINNLRKERNSGFIKDIFKKKILMLIGDENELREIIK